MALNILLSSAGRRVELIQRLRGSLTALGIAGDVLAVDASPTAPAAFVADAFEVVPRASDEGFQPRLVELIAERNIGLIVPTIDTELEPLSAASRAFNRNGAGAQVLISGPSTIRACSDKERTHRFLMENGLPCPQQWSAVDAREGAEALPYPVIIKPREGSSSIGVSVAMSADTLRQRVRETDIVQSLAAGDEYTVDVWVDRSGAVRSAVPRRRIEVRAGEVSKAVTERNPLVIALATRVATLLPDAYGPLTIQIFADANEAQVIEVNPRFGGGYPLSWESGARTTRWAIQDALGVANEPEHFEWQAGLTMLRYDQSVFVQDSEFQ